MQEFLAVMGHFGRMMVPERSAQIQAAIAILGRTDEPESGAVVLTLPPGFHDEEENERFAQECLAELEAEESVKPTPRWVSWAQPPRSWRKPRGGRRMEPQRR